MAKKSVKDYASNSCTFCNIKDSEIQKLNKKIVDLEFEKQNGKKKKEYTEEQLEQLKKKNEDKKKKKEEKEKEYAKLKDENKKLKNELLVKFGVSIE
jgi:chromosome segregation ATPase